MSNLGPLVSIVIPVFNGSNYLGEAIESALNQTYDNCEIIVVNDGSSDNGLTRDIALSYREKIRYFEKANGGVSSALNFGIDKMSGDYFSWLSHDDVYLPNKIECQVEFLNKENCELVYSNYFYINSVGLIVKKKTEAKKYSKYNFSVQLLLGYPIHGCATLIHKNVFEKIGLFDESLPTTQDYDFFFRCSKNVKIKFLDEILVKCRIHDFQNSYKNKHHNYECDEMYTKFSRYLLINNMLNEETMFLAFLRLFIRNYLSAAFMIFNSFNNYYIKIKSIFFIILFFLFYRSIFTPVRKFFNFFHKVNLNFIQFISF